MTKHNTTPAASASRHTPNAYYNGVRLCDSDPVTFEDGTTATAPEIYACVNALAGMNPEAVKDAVEALESVLKHFVTKESFPAWNDGGTNDRFIELATIETQARAALHAALKGSK